LSREGYVSRDTELEELAERILATLDSAATETLFAFAEGLAQADGPVRTFHLPIYYVASNREAGIEGGFLPRGSMCVALKPGPIRRDALTARLEGAETPFWVAVRDALVELAEDHPRADPWPSAPAKVDRYAASKQNSSS
jgi:hypothetical protein